MVTYPFLIADVFTETAFGGNPLAVIPDARDMSERTMQAVAREFNLSETTFVLPPDDARHLRRVRIFTPVAELSFAGHPTIGTAAILAHLGTLDLDGASGTAILELGVGPVTVEVRMDGRALFSRLTLERALDLPAQRPRAADAARALSLETADVLDAWFAGAGADFCFIHLASQAAVDRAVLDRSAWLEHFGVAHGPPLFLFSGTFASGERLHARLFAPGLGIAEDPATGAACAVLAGVLAERAPQPSAAVTLKIDQGVAMGRPSLIAAAAEKSPAHPTRMMVGGSTVIVARGSLELPADP